VGLVRTSRDTVVVRPPRNLVAARGASEWSSVLECWESASVGVRLGCVLATAIALIASMTGAIPIACGLAIATLVPAVLTDTQVRRLPDVWIASAGIVLLVGVGVSWSTGSTSTSIAGLAAGALLMSVPILLLHLASPASMGFGDVKLAIVLGAAVGALDWNLAIPALALAAGSTATIGVCTRARHIAFGPGLVAGALVALLAQDLVTGG